MTKEQVEKLWSLKIYLKENKMPTEWPNAESMYETLKKHLLRFTMASTIVQIVEKDYQPGASVTLYVSGIGSVYLDQYRKMMKHVSSGVVQTILEGGKLQAYNPQMKMWRPFDYKTFDDWAVLCDFTPDTLRVAKSYWRALTPSEAVKRFGHSVYDVNGRFVGKVLSIKKDTVVLELDNYCTKECGYEHLVKTCFSNQVCSIPFGILTDQ